MSPITLADAVVTALNAAAFSQAITAERHYLPRFNITKGELDQLRVVVMPGRFALTRFERDSRQRESEITIGVLKKLDVPKTAPLAAQHAELDPLTELSNEIAQHFAPSNDDDGAYVFNGGAAEITEVEAAPLYAPEHLESPRQFTGVIVLTITHYDD